LDRLELDRPLVEDRGGVGLEALGFAPPDLLLGVVPFFGPDEGFLLRLVDLPAPDFLLADGFPAVVAGGFVRAG
jgi:hypothetical protein